MVADETGRRLLNASHVHRFFGAIEGAMKAGRSASHEVRLLDMCAKHADLEDVVLGNVPCPTQSSSINGGEVVIHDNKE